MARRKKKKSLKERLHIPTLDLDPDTKKGIFIMFVLAFGAVSLLGLFDLAGVVGKEINGILTLYFGWGRWIIPILILSWGYMLYDEERFELKFSNYLGVLLFILSLHCLLFLFVEYDKWPNAIEQGIGGGKVGLLLAEIFIKLLGYIATLLISLCLVIVSILLSFNTSLANLFGPDSLVAKLFFPVRFVFGKIFRSKEEGDEEEEEEGEEEEEENDEEEEEEENDEEEEEENDEEEEEEENDEEEEENDEEEEEEENDEEEEENDEEEEEEENDEEEEENDEEEEEEHDEEENIPNFAAKEVRAIEEELWWQKKLGIELNIPLGLLNSKKGKPTSGDLDKNKDTIQNALSNFGIPVEMGDVSVGPTVTQYTFRPSEGIKLAKIKNLSSDLALALAAHPIRIEAPIPGTHLVGVEVPNHTKAMVTLKESFLSDIYKERKKNTMMALGKDVAGKVWMADVTKMPHMLVAGATNSGKSVCLNTIIVSLLYQNSPDDLKFIMVDPKRVELPIYNEIPHLLTPVITDVNKTINALKWCLNEMDTRFDMLAKSHKRDIQSYNESAKIKMPYLIFIIDELADLMVTASKEIEGAIIRLAQMARAVGIHLILATQRPSVDVITGLIKANMPGRIAFSVASGTDSRTILDTLGAEKLLGQGDMLFQNAELSKPIRLQGAFLSDNEIKKVVKYVKKECGKAKYLDNVTERQKVKGNAGVGLDGVKGDEDDLLLEARETVVNMGKASASLLQRKLRIGYARAASILDQLEEMGVIGPSKGSKPRDILITKQEMMAMDDQGISGVSLHSRKEAQAPENYLGEESEYPPKFKKSEEEDEEDDDDEEEEENEEEHDEDENDEEHDEEENDDEEEDNEDEDENEDEEDEENDEEENDDEVEKLFSR